MDINLHKDNASLNGVFDENLSEVSELEAAAYLTDEEIGVLAQVEQAVSTIPFVVARITIELRKRVQLSTNRRCSLYAAAGAVARHVRSMKHSTIYRYANALQYLNDMFPGLEVDEEVPFSAIVYAREIPPEKVPEFLRRARDEKDVPVSRLAIEYKALSEDEGERMERIFAMYKEAVMEAETKSHIRAETVLQAIRYVLRLMEILSASPHPYHAKLRTAIAVLYDLAEAIEAEQNNDG